MSYLDVPRLHFSGEFYTDPSTINNYTTNYDVDFLKESVDPSKLKWNPNGSHSWRFRDCAVRSVCYGDGTVCDDASVDPVIGMPFSGNATPYPAKLTSFDVQAQIIYEIWAFNQVGVGEAGHVESRDRAQGETDNTVSRGSPANKRPLSESSHPLSIGGLARRTVLQALSILPLTAFAAAHAVQTTAQTPRARATFAQGFHGKCRLTQGVDGWQRAPMPPDLMTNNPFYTAHFLTVLDDVEWGKQITSPFLLELKKRSPEKLAINFIADGYTDDPFGKGFVGRLVGTVGPLFAGDPPHFLRGRQLCPTRYDEQQPYLGTPMFYTPLKVDERRRKIIVDLGNSTPTTGPAGSPPELGHLRLAILSPDVVVGKPLPAANDLGRINLVDAEGADLYTRTAYVQEFELKGDVERSPLAIVRLQDGSTRIASFYLKEDAQGRYLAGEVPRQKFGKDKRYEGEGMAIRMNPGDLVRVRLTAMVFGKAPSHPVEIQLSQTKSFLDLFAGDQGTGGIADSGVPPIGVPEDALQIVSCTDRTPITSVTTDRNGFGDFCIAAHSPLINGKPPRYGGRLDGQVYGVAYRWTAPDEEAICANPWNFISVKIHNSHKLTRSPTWGDVRPIFAQITGLYPYMKRYLDLSDYAVVSTPRNVRLIKSVLRLPVTHPNFMPVTRDLSRDNRDLILRWLDAGAPAGDE